MIIRLYYILGRRHLNVSNELNSGRYDVSIVLSQASSALSAYAIVHEYTNHCGDHNFLRFRQEDFRSQYTRNFALL